MSDTTLARSRLSARRRSLFKGAEPALLVVVAGIVLTVIITAALFAPLLAPHDPVLIAPANRLQAPGMDFPLGTDAFGRDLLSRLLYGGRVSLVVGIGVALASASAGLFCGLMAGYFPAAGAVIMRAMDGLMAIPNILLATAIIALWGGNIVAVLVAITIPEIPRVARLVHAITLTTRTELYVQAAVALGMPSRAVLWRHVMPNTFGPLVVQIAYVCASAILLESMLSFLGIGINPQTPSWGNMMADGRLYFQLRPSMVLWPGLLVSLTILSMNVLGDAARDWLDPQRAQRIS
jgi:peptide/nickel transport system permease protein